MPQFEFEADGQPPALMRARDPLDAARRVLEAPTEDLTLTEPDEEGWQAILRAGAIVGRTRLHQRMRFRRD
ncbi:MAG: hypothetical protein AAFP18_13785 [Bacteroidota bacterium]